MAEPAPEAEPTAAPRVRRPAGAAALRRPFPIGKDPVLDFVAVGAFNSGSPSVTIDKEMEQSEPPPPGIELGKGTPEDTADSALLMIASKLGGLAALLEQVQEAEEEVRGQVQHARDLGATWAQIGQVAGIKPQSAYTRWSDTGRRKHREYEKKRRDSYTPPAS